MCLAVPGKILEAEDVGISRIANVQFGGIHRKVYLDFVPDAKPGDYILVHVGFAISKVEAEEAERTYELLRQLEEEDRL
jgi:hydrogenase expression/formation protein HypC